MGLKRGGLNRRGVLGGLAALAVALAGGAAIRLTHLFGKHYPPTPYDDLLDQITDREPAAILGAEVLKNSQPANPARLAAQLRAGESFRARAASDAASHRLVETAGWVLPESVALYAALAAAAHQR